MPYEQLLYEVRNRVATLTINRPDKRNSLSWKLIGELRAAVARARADDEVRVVVLTGAGDKAFCAGADLTGMAGVASARRSQPAAASEASAANDMAEGAGWAELHSGRGELALLFRDLWELGKPVIARVRGYALAGGFGLALACDLVVAAEDAQFGVPEIDVGLWPYMITVPLLRSLPPKRVLELMMTGRRIDAAEADRLGFVTRVVPVGELDAAVAELAGVLAAKSPTAMRLGRDSFYNVLDQPAEPALRLLHSMLTVTAATEDAAEGLAAFAEKRPPKWKSR